MQLKNKKKLFILYGFINFLITNIILQLLLLILSTIYATLISQVFNLLFGFYFYGKNVFRVNILKSSHLIKYVLLNILLWNINWLLIDLISAEDLSKNIASLILITPLALISYSCQKLIVFRK